MRILSIDPSGTGTSGIYYRNGKVEKFSECKEREWKNHYKFIQQLVKVYQPNILLFEDTNYIHSKTKDGLSLFRLLGSLEYLGVEKIEKVNVLKVKELSKKLLKGTYQITELEYKVGRGKGWMFKGKRISIHCLEAYLVYLLWNNL